MTGPPETIAGEILADGEIIAKIAFAMRHLQHPYVNGAACTAELLELITAERAAERARVTEEIATAIEREHACRPGFACTFPGCRHAQADAALARRIGAAT